MNPNPDMAGTASFWTAPAKRSGDGAFEFRSGFQSGVALRLPPQSKFVPVIPGFIGLNIRPGRMNAGQIALQSL